MTEKYHIALVVGRSFIRSALIDETGNILPDSFSIFSAKANETQDNIIQNMVKIIKFNINSILHPNFHIEKIGISFSEPFDYENGISYLQGTDKFDALYQVNLKDTLYDALEKVPSIKTKLSVNSTIQFENEAKLFGIGEQELRRKTERKKRVLYLIMGSSFSSVILNNGKIHPNQDGQLYEAPFKAGTISDYLSQKGLVQIANDLGMNMMDLEASDLSKEATAGNETALALFDTFGKNLAEALNPHLKILQPDEIIIGGSMVSDYPLYSQSFIDHLEVVIPTIYPTEFTPYHIFLGLAKYLK